MAATAHDAQQQEITLLQERNAGTFARVYLAEVHGQGNVSRIVAVKVLKTQWSQDPQLLSRTHDEARLLGRLHHRNILRVEGMANLDGHPAIIMEFVDGVDLRQIIEKAGAFPPRAAYQAARDTAAALEAAYFRVPYGLSSPLHVVHRDIKPSNIMISVEGEVKVLDFGTARYQNEIRSAHTGALRFGSLKYMSPERRDGDRGEHASDIYALGIVLLEMLLGELLPIIPVNPEEHDRYILGQMERLRDLGMPNPEWETSFRQTLARMCAYQPEHRLNAQQVAQLMRAFADQATGASLDTYAAQDLRRLTESLHGAQHKGSLTGTRLRVTLTSSGSYQGGSTSATLDPPASMEDTNTSTDPAYGLTDPAASTPAFTPPPHRERTLSLGHEPAAVQPEFSPSPTFDTNPETSFDGLSPHRDASFLAEPAAEPYAAYSDTPAAEPPPGRQRNLLLLGVGAAFIGVVLAFGFAAIIGGVVYFLLPQKIDGPPDTPPPDDPIVVTDDAATVHLRADDDSLQWVRLNDDTDETLLKADPDAVGAVAPGDYVLVAKVVARSKVSAPVTVPPDGLDLSCTPSDDGKTVTCADGDGITIVLK